MKKTSPQECGVFHFFGEKERFCFDGDWEEWYHMG